MAIRYCRVLSYPHKGWTRIVDPVESLFFEKKGCELSHRQERAFLILNKLRMRAHN